MKHFLISIFVIIPALLFSQDKGTAVKMDPKKIPVQSVRTELFKVINLSISKLQPDNTGEVLETVFQVENQTNIPMELYIFVIATYEKEYITKSSFEKPSLDDRIPIKFIMTYPDDLSNYEYTEKDPAGTEKKVYYKTPKNIKAGIEKKTGKPHKLEDIILFTSHHFSKYRKNYCFFNQVTILIFDSEEKLLFHQNYYLKPVKR
jgi:hypothetical protein